MARLSWDKADILQALKKLHKEGRDLSYTQLAKKMQPLVSAAAYHFGSYRAAVERAGIQYADVVRRPRWTKPQIIKLIKQAKRQTGIETDTDLIEFALATVALEDNFADVFKESRGKVDPKLKLGF